MPEAANRPDEILTIKRDKTVEEATTLMIMHRYSQLPITQDMRRIDGMISWRSMGRARASGKACEFVRDCMEEVRILEQDAADPIGAPPCLTASLTATPSTDGTPNHD